MPQGVSIDFTANLARFSSSIDKATNDLNKFQTNASRMAGNVSKAFKGIGLSLAGIVGTAGFVALTKNALDSADAIGKAAERTAFTTDALQALRFQAGQAGISFNELDGGLARFTKRLGLARAGTGAAADTYRKLGIDLGQTNEQVFRQVVDTLGDMEDQTNRVALTTRFFGDDAQRLETIFRGGTIELDAFAQKAEELGLILDEDLIKNSEAANDQLEIMQQIIKTQITAAIVEIAPLITAAGQAFADFAREVRISFGEIQNLPTNLVLEKINVITSQIEAAKEQLAESQRREKSGSLKDALKDIFLPSSETIQERIEELDIELETAWKRLGELNLKALDKSVAANPVDVSKFFGGSEELDKAAEKAAESLAKEREAFMRAIGSQAEEITKDVLEVTDAMKEAARVFDDTRTPAENLATELEKLDALFASGNITLDTYSRAVFNAQEAFESMTEETKSKSEELDDTWKSLGLTFSSAFEDAIVEGAKFRDLLGGLEKDILRIFTRKLVTEPLSNAISGLAGNLFGGFSLPAAANGADFMVGGSGNADSRLVAFMATPGERVTVTPKGVSTGSTINITVNNSGGSGNSASDSQLAAKIGQAVNRAMRRNT